MTPQSSPRKGSDRPRTEAHSRAFPKHWQEWVPQQTAFTHDHYANPERNCMKELALLCIAALATPLARAAPRDISAEIAALRPSIISAKLYANRHDNFTYRRQQREEDVARGCYYAETGDNLGSLLDLLASAGLKEIAPNKYGFEARTVLYLTTEGGATIPLVLSMENSNASVRGEYNHAVPVEARGGFGAALREWEARHTLTSPTSENCTGSFHFE